MGKNKRILGRTDILVLSFGAMIGWGWVIQSGLWILSAGTLGAIIAFLLGGIMIYFIALTYAELTSAMPENGGPQLFSKRAMGNIASFISSWAIIFGYISVVMFEAVALPTVLEYIYPDFSQIYMYTIADYDVNLTWVLIGMFGAITITYINYRGVKFAANIQKILTFILVSVGVTLISKSAISGTVNNLQPIFSNGFVGILEVLVLTPFFYVGFDVIPQSAGEINLPFKKIGKVLLLSVFFAVIWNVLIILAVSFSLTKNEISFAVLPTADSMKKVYGDSNLAANILIFGGLAGIVSSWNSFLMAGSKAIHTMAVSKMLPSFFAKVSSKYGTPSNAIFFIGGISALAPFLGRNALLWIANAGGISIVTAYFIVALSFLVLRKKEPDMKREYKVRNGEVVGVLAVIMSGIVFSLYVIPGIPSFLVLEEWLIIGSWITLGVILYIYTNTHKANL